MHPPGNRIPPELRKAILRYLSEQLDRPMISTAEAAEALAKQFPATTRPDIAEAIAETAIEAGFDISFDGDGVREQHG